MFYIRVALSLLGFVTASIYAVTIALLRRDRSRVAYDYAQAMARLMRPPLGLRVNVQGREKMVERRPCIYIANHQSALDVPVLAELHLPETVVIGKKELADIPFFGWLYRVTGNILIDRSNRVHALGRLREAEVAIRERQGGGQGHGVGASHCRILLGWRAAATVGRNGLRGNGARLPRWQAGAGQQGIRKPGGERSTSARAGEAASMPCTASMPAADRQRSPSPVRRQRGRRQRQLSSRTTAHARPTRTGAARPDTCSRQTARRPDINA